MTSFHQTNQLTGTQAPGGSFGTVEEIARLKLVAADRIEDAPMPTSFRKPNRLMGGTGAKRRNAKFQRRAVCQTLGDSGTTSSGRGAGSDVSPAAFWMTQIADLTPNLSRGTQIR